MIKGKLPDGSDLFLQANSQGYGLTTYVRLRYSEVMKMAAVAGSYKLMAQEGFRLGAGISYPVGIVFAACCFVFYLTRLNAKAG